MFGDAVQGTRDEPGVVHYLRKVVAGLPNRRPAWCFDVAEQGEGLADTGVHLVDRVHEILFPEQSLDWRRNLEILAASRWPTLVSLAQFREITGESSWPESLAPWIRRDTLEYFCNGRVDYRIRGVHVRLEVRRDWQAERGDDTHQATYHGTRCSLAVRQGPAERFPPELYVLPDADVGPALQQRIDALQPSYPGIGVETQGSERRIVMPDALRIGHGAAFAVFTRRFLAWVADPASLPTREKPNLLAKYRVTTGAVELSRG